jgi:hypothetical protein
LTRRISAETIQARSVAPCNPGLALAREHLDREGLAGKVIESELMIGMHHKLRT